MTLLCRLQAAKGPGTFSEGLYMRAGILVTIAPLSKKTLETVSELSLVDF